MCVDITFAANDAEVGSVVNGHISGCLDALHAKEQLAPYDLPVYLG